MIVPFAAGGPTDVLARILRQNMSQSLGVQVVVENVTGAGGGRILIDPGLCSSRNEAGREPEHLHQIADGRAVARKIRLPG
jgi:hypothetical protein